MLTPKCFLLAGLGLGLGLRLGTPRNRCSVWLVGVYAHVFTLLSVVVVPYPCVAGHFNPVGNRRHSAVVGRPHHKVADDERFAVHQAVRGGDERVGDQVVDDAGHTRQLAEGREVFLRKLHWSGKVISSVVFLTNHVTLPGADRLWPR